MEPTPGRHPGRQRPAGAHLATCNHAGIPNQTDVFQINNAGSAQVSYVESAGVWGHFRSDNRVTPGPVGTTRLDWINDSASARRVRR